jgi:hypothetical protein
MIQRPEDEEPAAERDALTKPTKRVRRRRPASVADIRDALRRIEGRNAPKPADTRDPSFTELLEKVRDTLMQEQEGRAGRDDG